jgi:thiamine pyridinylase
MRPRCRTVLLLCLVALLLPARPHADTPRRVLHVSLYPYIPDPSDAALTLKQGFEHQYPDVIVDITFNRNYYSPESADHGVLFETADVHELDGVFLRDFADRGKLAPLPPALAAAGAGLEPLAAQSATLDGRLVAVPHWMCADFLIYRADQSGLAGAPTLAAMEHALGSSHGLLMDLKGADTLGEYDLAALLARYGTAPAALSHAATPDPYITARLRRFLALEPPGFGRNADYDARGSFYARQFARRAGSAFVGYSEMTHEVLDETAVSCRIEDRCITQSEIRIAPLPFQDGTIHPAVWVDMFVIDAAVHGQSLQDAADFITYAVSLPAYRALLIPQPGDSPRYLLPATQAAFADPHILGTAPLYPSFRAILERGAVIIAPHLSATLHAAAAALDAALPERH